jgi:hypothetical protein
VLDRLDHVAAATKRSTVPWLIMLLESMRAEWHVSLHAALWNESITAALELWPAMLQRHGAEVEDESVGKARRRAREQAQHFITANFTVVK